MSLNNPLILKFIKLHSISKSLIIRLLQSGFFPYEWGKSLSVVLSLL